MAQFDKFEHRKLISERTDDVQFCKMNSCEKNNYVINMFELSSMNKSKECPKVCDYNNTLYTGKSYWFNPSKTHDVKLVCECTKCPNYK